MKKVAALMASAAMALTIGGISVSAAGTPGSCDSGHGAFGAFAHKPGTIESYVDADQIAGISLGSETGLANRTASEVCNG